MHSAICNLSRTHTGPLKPPVRTLHIQHSWHVDWNAGPAVSRPPTPTAPSSTTSTTPSLLATDTKQFFQIISMPALDGFHLVRLLSRGSRLRASGVDSSPRWSPFIHHFALDPLIITAVNRDGSGVGCETSRRQFFVEQIWQDTCASRNTEHLEPDAVMSQRRGGSSAPLAPQAWWVFMLLEVKLPKHSIWNNCCCPVSKSFVFSKNLHIEQWKPLNLEFPWTWWNLSNSRCVVFHTYWY